MQAMSLAVPVVMHNRGKRTASKDALGRGQNSDVSRAVFARPLHVILNLVHHAHSVRIIHIRHVPRTKMTNKVVLAAVFDQFDLASRFEGEDFRPNEDEHVTQFYGGGLQ